MAEALKSVVSNLNCSICLKIFTNPLSLLCGHTFCQTCIHEHWDSLKPGDEISCPYCREIFPVRPEPKRNISLYNVLEILKEMEQESLEASAESRPNGARTAMCKDHRRELCLYCCTERRCICSKCLVKRCRNHNFEDIEEQSEKEKRKLSNDFKANGHQKDTIEKEIEDWKQKCQVIKDSHVTLETKVMTKFDQARKTLEECQRLVVESVRREEKAALTQVSDYLQFLQQHLQDLNRYHAEAEQLLDAGTSDTEFLEALPRLAPVGCAPVPPNVKLCETAQMDVVTRILPEVTRLLQEVIPNALHPVEAQPGTTENSVKSSCVGAAGTCSPMKTSELSPGKLKNDLDPEPMNSLKTQLFQDYRNLTFDPETAHEYIEISDQNCKATHKTSTRAKLPASPKRFQSWQVMCKEGYSEGSHYWEVDISTFFVQIGLAYGSLKRSKEQESMIGRNKSSWSLHLQSMSQSVWHDDKEVSLKQADFRRIGVHLDCAAGSITFYGIKDGRRQRLHEFNSVFMEKLYPTFMIGEDVNIKLRQVK